ncbi:TPA: hypothetical protein ACH3X1_016374 [Trebouxia sp. C0004]
MSCLDQGSALQIMDLLSVLSYTTLLLISCIRLYLGGILQDVGFVLEFCWIILQLCCQEVINAHTTLACLSNPGGRCTKITCTVMLADLDSTTEERGQALQRIRTSEAIATHWTFLPKSCDSLEFCLK